MNISASNVSTYEFHRKYNIVLINWILWGHLPLWSELWKDRSTECTVNRQSCHSSSPSPLQCLPLHSYLSPLSFLCCSLSKHIAPTTLFVIFFALFHSFVLAHAFLASVFFPVLTLFPLETISLHLFLAPSLSPSLTQNNSSDLSEHFL